MPGSEMHTLIKMALRSQLPAPCLWLPCCSSNTPGTFPPLGLCRDCFPCQEQFPPWAHFAFPKYGFKCPLLFTNIFPALFLFPILTLLYFSPWHIPLATKYCIPFLYLACCLSLLLGCKLREGRGFYFCLLLYPSTKTVPGKYQMCKMCAA